MSASDSMTLMFARQQLTTGQSLLMMLPLFCVYQFAVGFYGEASSIDFVTPLLWNFSGNSPLPYLALCAALYGTLTLYALFRPHRFALLAPRALLPVMLEAGIYALTLGSVIWLVLSQVLPMNLNSGSLFVASAGAGIFEELAFRLVAFGCGGLVLMRLTRKPRVSFVLPLVGSSLVFSLLHHVGLGNEIYDETRFWYRALAGIAFALIFYYRSLAHAVYAHCFYDLYALGVFA